MAGKRLVCERQTEHTLLRVIDHGKWRYLVFDDGSGDERLNNTAGVYQSKICKAKPEAVVDTYGAAFHIPMLYRQVTSCLFIGLGGGAIISQFLHWYPDLRITAVEIDPVVVTIARGYFSLPPNPRLTITIGDGRDVLNDTCARNDLICIDAFGARTIPRRLATVEFAELCVNRLSPGGMVAMNINGTLAGPGSVLQRRITAGFAAVFPDTALFPTIGRSPHRYQAIILAAGRTAGQLAQAPWQKVRQMERRGFTPRLGELVGRRIDVQDTGDPSPLYDDGDEQNDLLIYES